MSETEILALAAEVLAGIAPETELAGVGDDEDLREALDLDSMDFMNFVIALAQKTGRKIPEADTSKLFTMAALVGYLGG